MKLDYTYIAKIAATGGFEEEECFFEEGICRFVSPCASKENTLLI